MSLALSGPITGREAASVWYRYFSYGNLYIMEISLFTYVHYICLRAFSKLFLISLQINGFS